MVMTSYPYVTKGRMSIDNDRGHTIQMGADLCYLETGNLVSINNNLGDRLVEINTEVACL